MVSPISTPNTPDKAPVSAAAVTRTVDQLLWALVEVLLEAKVLKSDELVVKLRPFLDQIRKTGRVSTPDDYEREATVYATDRVIRALEKHSV